MTYPQTIDPSQANKETPIQEDLRALHGASVYGRRDAAIAGLVFGYHGGQWDGNSVADGTNTCGASTTTYMVAARSGGAASFATATTNWNNGTTYGRCWALVSNGSGFTSIVDYRFSPGGIFASAGGAGGIGDVVGPASSTDSHFAQFDGTTGKLLKGGLALDTDGTLAANSNTRVPSQAALVTYVAARIAALIASAPGALDTLDELAAALGDDANFASTVTTALALKAPLASPALTGNPTVPTQTPGDNSTKAASTAYVDAAVSGVSNQQYLVDGTPASDDLWHGRAIAGLNAGATIAQWEAVYLASDGEWALADANGTGTYPARGLAVAAGTDGNPLTVITEGVVRNDAWAWTVGGQVYLSGTAGALTQTAPSTTGDKLQLVGFALSADVLYLCIGAATFIEIA